MLVEEKTHLSLGTKLMIGAVVTAIIITAVAVLVFQPVDWDFDEVPTATPKIYRIVVIDDDPPTLELNVEIAEMANFPVQVQGFLSCAQAKAAVTGPIDLAIIDGLRPNEYGPDCGTEVSLFWASTDPKTGLLVPTSILCYSGDEDIVGECKMRGFYGTMKGNLHLLQLIEYIDFILGQRPK